MGITALTPDPGAQQQPSEPVTHTHPLGTQIWRAAFEHAPDASVVVNAAGEIVEANRKCELLFGCPRDDLIGLPLERLLPVRLADQHRRHRLAYLSNPHPRPMGMGLELYGQPCQGDAFPIEVGLSPLSIDGESLV